MTFVSVIPATGGAVQTMETPVGNWTFILLASCTATVFVAPEKGVVSACKSMAVYGPSLTLISKRLKEVAPAPVG